MAKKYREHRDNYTLRFNDDTDGVVWTTGNLLRFLRNLWNANPILRELNPDRTARDFALRVGASMYKNMRYADKRGWGAGNFYLVPMTAAKKYQDAYAGKITRNVMKAAKVLG